MIWVKVTMIMDRARVWPQGLPPKAAHDTATKRLLISENITNDMYLGLRRSSLLNA